MAGGPLFVVLTGPSGVGKDSILDRLKKRGDPRHHFAITATTRPPRENERHTVDYFFLTKDEFARLLREGELLEHAIVYGQDKGLPRQPVVEALAAGKDVLMRTDVQGARYIKSVVPGALTIFIASPSIEELEQRMKTRGGDSPEQVELRLQTAREEMAAAEEFDCVIVNEDLERTVDAIIAVMEQVRADPQREPVRIP